jgi:hypothetical protein
MNKFLMERIIRKVYPFLPKKSPVSMNNIVINKLKASIRLTFPHVCDGGLR